MKTTTHRKKRTSRDNCSFEGDCKKGRKGNSASKKIRTARRAKKKNKNEGGRARVKKNFSSNSRPALKKGASEEPLSQLKKGQRRGAGGETSRSEVPKKKKSGRGQ